MSKKTYDREDYSYDVKDSIASSAKSITSEGGYKFDELDFDKFSAFMSKKFGEERFKKGFELIRKFKSDRFEKNSDLDTELKGVLSKETDVEDFVNLCSSYIILENYASSMGQ